MIRVLFVDDDPLILAGLKRLMRRIADGVQPEFANSGPEALHLLSERPFDAIVSDMRMPGMDGAELLTRVRDEFPDMIRMILSGQSAHESMFRALGPAHRFLSKPCKPEELKDLLTRAITLRDRLANHELRKLTGQIQSLPSLPSVYAELVEELHSIDGSIDRIGEIVGRDIGITAKMLHLVNSSFFGLPQHVSSPSQAVCLLGIGLVKSLVLKVGVFSQFCIAPGSALRIEQLSQHSIEVGKLAQKIARHLGASAQDIDEALLAGMMHDIGQLIFAAERAGDYEEVVRAAEKDGCSLAMLEQMRFGVSHADVGAYLLSIWGLPNSIVEAVAFHHHPLRLGGGTPITLTAVHLANALAREAESNGRVLARDLVSAEYLVAAGLDTDPRKWMNSPAQAEAIEV